MFLLFYFLKERVRNWIKGTGSVSRWVLKRCHLPSSYIEWIKNIKWPEFFAFSLYLFALHIKLRFAFLALSTQHLKDKRFSFFAIFITDDADVVQDKSKRSEMMTSLPANCLIRNVLAITSLSLSFCMLKLLMRNI